VAREELLRTIQYRDTQANIEADSAALEEGGFAYATDLGQIGIYTGGAWEWVGGAAISITATAGENLAEGDLVELYNNGGTLTARKATCATWYKAEGFVLDTITSGNTGTIYLSGTVTGLAGLTPGAKQFLSTNGDVTETATNTSGYIIQEVGVALSATTMIFRPQEAIELN